MSIKDALRNLDTPIQSFEEDLLQRRGFVESLCRIFEVASPDESTVFALYGEWGSGKTSVKNLLIKELGSRGDKSPLPIEFNPWAFSGQDQVLEAFFSEIGKAISREPKGKEVAEGFKKLGAYLSFGAKTAKTIHVGLDLFGIPGAKIAGMVGETLERGCKDTKEYGEQLENIGKASLVEIQQSLKGGLAKLERPFLVILDDLDRLTPDQLLLVFQIVKLNASLPNVNFLLLMDRKTAEERLTEKKLGAEFIEKIVQFELNLPHVSERELKAILRDGFKCVMGKFADQIEWEAWEEAWPNGCENLFTTLRRIKRFLHTLKFHVSLFANEDVLEVDPVDLLLAETVRKFAPQVYEEMPRLLRSVIAPNQLALIFALKENQNRRDFWKTELDILRDLIPKEIQSEIQRIIELMFPQIQSAQEAEQNNEWIRRARICHEIFFESYFRLAIPRQLPTQQEIKTLFELTGDRVQLHTAMVGLYEKVDLVSLLVRIQSHHNRLNVETLPNLLAELWLLDTVDTKKLGLENKWDGREATQAITRFLLRKFTTKETRCDVALKAFAESNAIFPLTRFWDSERREVSQNPNSNQTAFDKEDLERLRPSILQSIQRASENGELLASPHLKFLLMVWQNLESKDRVSEWLANKAKEPIQLAKALGAFIEKTTINSHRETKYAYYLTRKELELFFSRIEDLLEPLHRLEIQNLPQWEKLAVEETLKRIDEKARGIEEANYLDQV